MSIVKIHESGSGADKLVVESHMSGIAVYFGEAPEPCRTLFFQPGDEAETVYDTLEICERLFPYRSNRENWLGALDPYLD